MKEHDLDGDFDIVFKPQFKSRKLNQDIENMTKREIRIEALRTAAAMLQNPPEDWAEEGISEEDIIKIQEEVREISMSIYKRAARLGGDFNIHTGYPFKS